MSESPLDRSVGLTAARVGLVVGGLVCLVVTPQLTTTYYFAYGRTGGDPPPPEWLSNVGWPNWFDGSGAVAEYKSYGVVFGCALLLVAVSLGVVVGKRSVKGRKERRAWRLIVGGLGAVGVGAVSEYGIPEDLLDPGNGFGLELLGFLVVIGGTLFLGWALYREAGLGAVACLGIGAVGPVGIALGFSLIGHIPSGPAAPLVITAILIGAVGLPGTARPSRHLSGISGRIG